MEYGEGSIDCLKRECMEELGQPVEVLSHFYTTDFFQPARFAEGRQLISIYYRIRLSDPAALETSQRRFDFDHRAEGAMSFRWIDTKELSADMFTFPIDQKVATMLAKELNAH